MSDKKQAVIHIYSTPFNAPQTLLDRGYAHQLAFRKATAPFHEFDSITGISLLSGDLNERLKQMELTRLESKFYNPFAKTVPQIFHSQNVQVGLVTQDIALQDHAATFGILQATSDCHITFVCD